MVVIGRVENPALPVLAMVEWLRGVRTEADSLHPIEQKTLVGDPGLRE